jgi:hypothetical protein
MEVLAQGSNRTRLGSEGSRVDSIHDLYSQLDRRAKDSDSKPFVMASI